MNCVLRMNLLKEFLWVFVKQKSWQHRSASNIKSAKWWIYGLNESFLGIRKAFLNVCFYFQVQVCRFVVSWVFCPSGSEARFFIRPRNCNTRNSVVWNKYSVKRKNYTTLQRGCVTNCANITYWLHETCKWRKNCVRRQAGLRWKFKKTQNTSAYATKITQEIYRKMVCHKDTKYNAELSNVYILTKTVFRAECPNWRWSCGSVKHYSEMFVLLKLRRYNQNFLWS
jgi:hypothetical protein